MKTAQDFNENFNQYSSEIEKEMSNLTGMKTNYQLNTEGLIIDKKGKVIEFQFVGVEDYGHACCPHCGAEGRYVYTWIDNGVMRSAMAGCYKLLSPKVSKSDEERYFESLAEKQAKNKKLNKWDKNVLRLLNFKQTGKYPEDWCDRKINEVLMERKAWLKKNRYL